MFFQKLKKVTLATLIATSFLMAAYSMAHAYGGGDGRDQANNDKSAGLDNLTPAQLINAFGTKEMKEALAERIRQRKEILAKAMKQKEKLKKELEATKEKLREAARRIKEGDDSMEAEEEYFKAWKKAIHQQYAVKKSEADRLVALKNAIRVEDGLAPLDEAKEKQLRDYAKKEADKTFIENQVKFAEKVLKYGQDARDEADERDRQILRWTVVKYASMAGSAGLSGVAIFVKASQVGIAALSTAEASQLLSIAAALDIGGAGVGAAADSHASGKSVTETFIRGLSAAGVQALAGKLLGTAPSDTSKARNALIEFAKSVDMDTLQSALQSLPDDLKQGGGTAPPSAPNYETPVPTQQHAM